MNILTSHTATKSEPDNVEVRRGGNTSLGRLHGIAAQLDSSSLEGPLGRSQIENAIQKLLASKLIAHEKFAFSVDEACRLLSIGRTSLYAMASKGEIQLIKVAGRTLVPRSELERLTSVSQAA